MRILIILLCLFAIAAALPAKAEPILDKTFVIAQLSTPAAPGDSARQPTPGEERMLRRFPQPVRVGDLIGLPIIDGNHRTIGYVRKVVRTQGHKVELIVDYDGWFGWEAHPVAVPVEVVGIQGRELTSLDMPRSEYEAATPWRQSDETAVADDETIRVALSKQ